MYEWQTIPPCSIERVGRDGCLFLQYARSGHRTTLSRSFFRTPLQVLPPVELDEGRCAYTQILNPTGGVVGGDRLTAEVRLEAGTHVLLTTPSATRVYRSLGETAVQTTSVKIGADAVLEWVPEIVIPFAGSRFDQRIDVELDSGTILFLWDAFSAGRVARGERWAFALFKNEIHIMTSEGGEVLERYNIDTSIVDPTVATSGGCWDYFASFYIIAVRPADWSSLFIELASVLDQWPGRVLGGISRLDMPGLSLRLVAKTAMDLCSVQFALWDTARRSLIGIPVPSLRRY